MEKVGTMGSKFKATFIYQLYNPMKGLGVFYMVLFGVVLVNCILALSVSSRLESENVRISISSIGFSSAIFALVLYLSSFKEDLHMLVQNSVSRRTQFLSKLATMGVISLLLAVMSEAVELLNQALTQWMPKVSLSFSMVSLLFPKIENGSITYHLVSLGVNMATYLGLAGLGMLIGGIFYRLSKFWRIFLGAGVGLVLVMGVPMVDSLLFGGTCMKAILAGVLYLSGYTTGQPMLPILSMLGLFVLTSISNWLILRRTSTQ